MRRSSRVAVAPEDEEPTEADELQLQNFLHDCFTLHSSPSNGLFAMIVRYVHSSIVRGQGFSRDFLACQRARKIALRRAWDREVVAMHDEARKAKRTQRNRAFKARQDAMRRKAAQKAADAEKADKARIAEEERQARLAREREEMQERMDRGLRTIVRGVDAIEAQIGESDAKMEALFARVREREAARAAAAAAGGGAGDAGGEGGEPESEGSGGGGGLSKSQSDGALPAARRRARRRAPAAVFGNKDDKPKYSPEQEAAINAALSGYLRTARRAEIRLRIALHKAKHHGTSKAMTGNNWFFAGFEKNWARTNRKKQALETNRKLLQSFYQRRAPEKAKNVNALIDYYITNGGESSAKGTGAEQLALSIFETYGEQLDFVIAETTPREEEQGPDNDMLEFLGDLKVAPPPKVKPHVYIFWSSPTFKAEIRDAIRRVQAAVQDFDD